MRTLAEAAYRHHYYTSTYYGSGLGHGTLGVLALIAICYAVFHLLAGLGHHGYRRSRGHRANLGWSLLRGPFASYRIGRRTTVYERL